MCVFSSGSQIGKETPPADDLRGGASPVATEPRRTRDERPRRPLALDARRTSASAPAPPQRPGVRREVVRGRAQGGPAAEGGGAVAEASLAGAPLPELARLIPDANHGCR